jgi:hypothetical protein
MAETSSEDRSSKLIEMLRQIVGSVLSLVATFIGLLAVTFVISRVVPIDPAQALLGNRATQAQIDEAREQFGLNKPMWEQFGIYTRDALRGDFGNSIRTHKPVLEEVRRYFPATLELATLATIIGVAIGIPAGVLAATRPGSLSDQLVRLVGLMGYSMPVFWLGLVGLLVFYGKLGWVGGPGRLDAAFDMMLEFELTSVHRHDPCRYGSQWPLGHVCQCAKPHHLAGQPPGLHLHGLHQPDDPLVHDERIGPGVHHDGTRQGHARAARDLGPRNEERPGSTHHRGRAELCLSAGRLCSDGDHFRVARPWQLHHAKHCLWRTCPRCSAEPW